MAETIPGGRYTGPDGKAHDAHGNLLDKAPSADAQAKADQAAAAGGSEKPKKAKGSKKRGR